MAEPGDEVADSPALWLDSRPQLEFGTLTIAERVDELAPERRKMIFDLEPCVDGMDSAGDPLNEVRSDIYLLLGRRRAAPSSRG
jgi:catalase